MLIILYYGLKVIICSGLLFGYYLVALRNNRFHRWNRYYLLAAVTLSFTLPLLKIELPFFSGDEQPVLIQSFQIISAPDIYFSKLHQKTFAFTWPVILAVSYTGIALFFLVIFIKNIYKVQKLKKLYPDENLNGIHFYNTQEPGTPFSFFKNIFWNSSISLNNEKGQQMLRHEITHIQEKHSVDKVAMELLIAFAWWNPFLFYIRKELSVIHEFIADQKASAGDDNLQYASLLLMKAMGSEQYSLGNPFFHSQLKRRLTMLTTIRNPKFSYTRRLMVLPLAVIAIALFSFKYKQVTEWQMAKNKTQSSFSWFLDPVTEVPLAVHGFYEDTAKKKGVEIKAKGAYKGSPILTITPTDDERGVVIKTKDAKTYFLSHEEANSQLGILMPRRTGLKNNYQDVDSVNNPIYVIDGKEVTDDEVSKFDVNRIKSTHVLKGEKATTQYGEKGKNGVILITTKEPSLPGNPLYVINGKETTSDEAKDIAPDNIKSIDVVKGEQAMSIYGEKGKNGVIIITTKQAALPGNALYMIDDKEVAKEQAEKLITGGIEKVSVWKGEDAIKKFGEKGKNGVIVITTKLAKNEVTLPEAGQSDGLAEVTIIGYRKKPESGIVFTKVDEPASFPGGQEGWARYLERNLSYPEVAQKNNTQGAVKVKMTVNEEGFLSDIEALNNPGNGLAEEAVRVIKKGPTWIPAKQKGKVVKYTFVQTIHFGLQ